MKFTTQQYVLLCFVFNSPEFRKVCLLFLLLLALLKQCLKSGNMSIKVLAPPWQTALFMSSSKHVKRPMSISPTSLVGGCKHEASLIPWWNLWLFSYTVWLIFLSPYFILEVKILLTWAFCLSEKWFSGEQYCPQVSFSLVFVHSFQ